MASSMLAAWIYCWHRLYTTVRNAVADYEEWIDLAFAKVLADAARYKDELVRIAAHVYKCTSFLLHFLVGAEL